MCAMYDGVRTNNEEDEERSLFPDKIILKAVVKHVLSSIYNGHLTFIKDIKAV